MFHTTSLCKVLSGEISKENKSLKYEVFISALCMITVLIDIFVSTSHLIRTLNVFYCGSFHKWESCSCDNLFKYYPISDVVMHFSRRNFYVFDLLCQFLVNSSFLLLTMSILESGQIRQILCLSNSLSWILIHSFTALIYDWVNHPIIQMCGFNILLNFCFNPFAMVFWFYLYAFCQISFISKSHSKWRK